MQVQAVESFDSVNTVSRHGVPAHRLPPMLATSVLAHQGGWDEILMVVAPLVLFVLLLRAANRSQR